MNFIDQFMSSVAHVPSPEIFKLWAAINCVAGALERKVWVYTAGSALYPTLYTILVAPPGVGKTEVIWRVRQLWDSLPDHYLASSSVSKASLIDSLNDAKRAVTDPTKIPASLTFNALLIASNELGVLIPSYDMEFMNTLTDLFDCKPYAERRRTNKVNIEIPRPFLTMLAGCTPAYLQSTLPEGAWDQGFTSRTIMVYSGDIATKSLFEEYEEDEEVRTALEHEILRVSKLHGKFQWTPEAAQFMDRWHLDRLKTKPDHPRLLHYNTRRTVHLLKLCMVASAAEGDSLLIELSHVQRALDWLTEAEFHMGDIFKAMSSNSATQLIQETWHFVNKHYQKGGKKGVPAPRVFDFVAQRTPAHNVERVLDVMVKAGFMAKEMSSKGDVYIPRVQEE